MEKKVFEEPEVEVEYVLGDVICFSTDEDPIDFNEFEDEEYF